MRVLVVDEELPWPTNTGKRIRTFELMRRLAASFDLTFAFHDDQTTSAEGLDVFRREGIRTLPVLRPPLKKAGLRFAWDLARNVALSVPYMVMAHRTSAMTRAIETCVTEGTDLVHFEWTPLVANLPQSSQVPVCIAAHNVEARIWKRYTENERNALRRSYIRLQWQKVARFESRALAEAQGVVAVSEEDAEEIRTFDPTGKVAVVPNGVNQEYFAPQPYDVSQPDSAVFVGSLDWRPNLDGLAWFLEDVWPMVRERRPAATLDIVGRSPPEWLSARAAEQPGVRLSGSVPDVRPHVARAAVSVVPLRIGGGSRLKICESFAMQRPVVSTAIGAEGLRLGDEIVRADEPGDLAESLTNLFEDRAAAADLALRGYDRVLERYTWDRIAPSQADLWGTLIVAAPCE